MRAVIQRVKQASVTVDNDKISEINQGILVLLGIEKEDSQEDVQWLCSKIIKLRIFEDESGAMNKSLLDLGGEVLVVSQFTLHASTKKGNRPSFIKAAKPFEAIPLYQMFITQMESDLGKTISTGIFGAMMQVSLINDGPVTISIDTKNKE
ncbi:MAG: D-tyrosyl-tRNA(Tyr) deacylase [Bacteroidetes bacterium HGW-Bacteroidetes-2]|jgi:D-tyrosyl-tRNA(Tyr) deacylase|nr:MAG: D-tyrosyl-tRNA(Tyr) deacylase [Bacteroidetes bacterium HGW-Bacteroidetes-2]